MRRNILPFAGLVVVLFGIFISRSFFIHPSLTYTNEHYSFTVSLPFSIALFEELRGEEVFTASFIDKADEQYARKKGGIIVGMNSFTLQRMELGDMSEDGVRLRLEKKEGGSAITFFEKKTINGHDAYFFEIEVYANKEGKAAGAIWSDGHVFYEFMNDFYGTVPGQQELVQVVSSFEKLK